MRNSWFYKLLLSYLPAFFVISLSLLLIAYLTISELSRRSAEKASDELSRNMVKLLDHTLGSIDAIMQYELQNNGRIRAFYRDDPAGGREYADLQAAAALKELLANNPEIDSVYLFRATDQKVLTPSTLAEFAQFGDRAYIGNQIGSATKFRWTARMLPRSSGTGKAEGSEVVSLAKIAEFKYNSLLVVNVKSRHMHDILLGMYDPAVTAVRLYDAQGEPIFRIGSEAAPRRELAAAERRLGNVRSDYTGWTIWNESRSAAVLSVVSSLFYVWIGFGCLVIVAGVAWFVYVTRQNYRPVQSILNRIADIRGDRAETRPEPAETKDDFHLIASTIEQLFGESVMLQEQNKENLVYRKRHIFLRLLEAGTEAEAAAAAKEAQLLGFPLSSGSAIAAVVEIDQYAEFVRQYVRDQYLLKSVLVMVAKEMAENKPYHVWAEWVDSQRLAALFVFRDAEAGETDIVSMCGNMREWVESNLDFTVTIGIGSHETRPEAIRDSYRGALNALRYKPSLGDNRVIDRQDYADHDEEDLFRHLRDIRELCQSFRSGDELWEERLNELHRTLRSRLFVRDDLQNVLNVLIYHLNREMDELPGPYGELWNGSARQRLQEALRELETLDGLMEAFRSILAETFREMRTIRESQSTGALIQNMKAHIDDNYSNPDFSLGHLSGEFGLSGGYLSRLFKDSFGVRFVEYVTDIRIEKAKRLLADTETAIQDIAVAVGYTNSLTFIRVFKKHTGITPGQYRKDARQA